jgi:hypothetical protein
MNVFRDVCHRMVTGYKVGRFGIDGTANANSVVAGSRFDSGFDAVISPIGQPRKSRPDLRQVRRLYDRR